jgi:hypothetical protein
MTHSSMKHSPNAVRFIRTGLAAALPALFCACSGDVVNVGEGMGEDENPLAAVGACAAAPAGDVVASNQAELDALEGCEAIDGNFQIVPFAGADLRPLRALRTVTGWLSFNAPGDVVEAAAVNQFAELNETGWLTLDGLEALESVGSLYISGLDAPTLAPLSNLRVVTDGGLTLNHCGGLRDLHGLENLRGVDDLVVVCDELESMAALRLSGSISSIYIDSARLTELGSLDVSFVLNDITILRTALENLDAFASLRAVQGGLAILENPALTDLDGLAQLELSGGINIRGNAALERLPAFDALSRLKILIIEDNAVLSELPPFSALNADLPAGFSERDLLTFRPELIEINRNPELRQFDVPVGWESASYVRIGNNAALERVGLGQLTAIDRLEIEANSSLADVELGALATVDSLSVRDNPQLSGATFDAVQTFRRDMAGNAGTP